MPNPLLTRYLQPLLSGRRNECFNIIARAIHDGRPAAGLMREVVWPAMAQMERLFRDDRIDTVTDNMAARINRTVADQLQPHLPVRAPNGRRVIVVCADGEREELGAQLIADLFQSDGWETFLVGAGVPVDELLGQIGRIRPDALLVYGAAPQGAPKVRALVETIRAIGVCPHMNVIVTGGVFNRADGLWREVGADIFADSADDVLQLANGMKPRDPARAPRTGVVKQRRRKRRAQPQLV